MKSNNNNFTDKDGKASHDNAAFAGTSAMIASPSPGKRQRCPMFRLEELGDLHADRTRVCSPVANVYSPAHSKEDLCCGPDSVKLAKLSYTRAGARAKNYGHLKGGGPAEEKAPCYVNGLPKPNPVCKELMNENQVIHLQKTTSKGRGGRKPGVPKLNTFMPQSGTSIRGRGKDKVLCVQAAKGVHSDKENNAHSAAVFIGSENDSASDESGQDGVMMFNSEHDHKDRGYLAAQVQVRGGRTGQWAQPSSRRQDFEVMDDTDRRLLVQANGSACGPRGKLVITRNRLSYGVQNRLVLGANRTGNSTEPTHGRLLKQANGSGCGSRDKPVITGNWQSHDMQNRLVLEANGSGNSTEATECNIGHIASHYPLSPVGVREWLHNLGLGKYARLFEVHEVEPEVLPLLTLDDLREIGVLAVGPRRKMFCAIQQFREAMLYY